MAFSAIFSGYILVLVWMSKIPAVFADVITTTTNTTDNSLPNNTNTPTSTFTSSAATPSHTTTSQAFSQIGGPGGLVGIIVAASFALSCTGFVIFKCVRKKPLREPYEEVNFPYEFSDHEQSLKHKGIGKSSHPVELVQIPEHSQINGHSRSTRGLDGQKREP